MACRLSFSTQMRVRGVLYMRRAIQINVFTFLCVHIGEILDEASKDT